MGPAFRLYVALPHLLKPVITDCGGSSQPFLEIAWFDQVSVVLGMVAPYASKTIGLQFHAHGERIMLCRRATLLKSGDFPRNAEQILDMVPDLVRDDIGLGKVAGRAESLGHFVKEGKIQIDLLIAGTVERAHGGRGGAAGGSYCAGEEDHLRIFIRMAHRGSRTRQVSSVSARTTEANLPRLSCGAPVGPGRSGSEGAVDFLDAVEQVEQRQGIGSGQKAHGEDEDDAALIQGLRRTWPHPSLDDLRCSGFRVDLPIAWQDSLVNIRLVTSRRGL